jgi:hypothetical protein
MLGLAAAALIAGCGGGSEHSWNRLNPSPTPTVAAAGSSTAGSATAARPSPQEVVFLRRQYAAYAMAPEVHVYDDGSARVITPSGGAGMKREVCRLGAGQLADVLREVEQLPRRDSTAAGGSGDTFWIRVDAHTAIARQTQLPRFMRGLVHELAPLIDDDGSRCHTLQRYFQP